jgi:hypothetical protein
MRFRIGEPEKIDPRYCHLCGQRDPGSGHVCDPALTDQERWNRLGGAESYYEEEDARVGREIGIRQYERDHAGV